ncbi:hypothetical protein AAG747_18615 [Rapidithrix thailandica]|uniref:Polysaccharide biosynthesis protein n=1 Tax=Rapidithrix thailandica TaxID=413964 RepID=A0AAW9SBS9_9BACT
MKRHIQSLLSEKVLVLLDQAVFSGSSFVSTLLLARVLSPTDFGIYASVLLYIYLTISVTNALIIQPLQVSLAKIEIKEADSYLSFVIYGQGVLVLFIVGFTWGLMQFEIEFLQQLRHISFSIIFLLTGFLFHDFFRKVFLAKSEIRKALLIDSICCVLQISFLTSVYFTLSSTLSSILLWIGGAYIPAVLLAIAFTKPSFYDFRKWKEYIRLHLRQGSWLLMTAVIQWWANNLFVVASGLFLGVVALGAFRLVQSLFGVLNILLQTFENYALPQAARLYQSSSSASKQYLRSVSYKGAMIFGVILVVLFAFSESVIVLAGGAEYREFHFVVRGMTVLYFIIFIGYPVRMAIRMMLLNRSFFIGYILSFALSLLSFNYLLEEWHLWGAISGLIANQLIMLFYWQYTLMKKEFILWR